jgi:hypothetical protein
MAQVSAKLRNLTEPDGTKGFVHWCPACKEAHVITSRWGFNGNVHVPTFSPSVKITGKQIRVDERGDWTGEWVLGPDGKALDLCCHYFITDGQIQFCSDCTHELKGQTVPLPDLPAWLRD